MVFEKVYDTYDFKRHLFLAAVRSGGKHNLRTAISFENIKSGGGGVAAAIKSRNNAAAAAALASKNKSVSPKTVTQPLAQ